jgi:hypothetical protein
MGESCLHTPVISNYKFDVVGEEDQTCYDITRLRKPDSSFDRGYYYSTLCAKYKKGKFKHTFNF